MGRKRTSGIRRRASVVNGIFYPSNREIMTARLFSWGLREGSLSTAFGGQAILAPHGAWDITGNIAASAFAAIQEKIKKNGRPISRILLLGKYHNSGEEGVYLSESDSFETPLGDIPVDQKLNRKLASCSALIGLNDIPHLSEHCLEVLLPLVRYCFPAAKIVPILMSGTRPDLVSVLARALRMVLEEHMEESLVVISSTVSQDPDPVIALSMAYEFRSLLENMDTQTFLARLGTGHISACGGALLGAVLESGLLKGKRFSTLCPLAQDTGEKGEIFYFGAFASGD